MWFRAHDHITESHLSDAAAIFHVTRVRDAITLVIAGAATPISLAVSKTTMKDSSEAKKNIIVGLCVSPQEARTAANFLEYRIVSVRSVQLRLDLIVSPNIQLRSHLYIVPVLSSIRHFANTRRNVWKREIRIHR